MRAREQGVFCQAERGHSASAQALFGHKVQPGCSALFWRLRGYVTAMQGDALGRSARVLTRQRTQQFLLSVARHTGHAQDLAGTHIEAHAPQFCAEGVERFERQVTHIEHHFTDHDGTLHQRWWVGADHAAREARVALLSRVHFAHHLAAAQHRAACAQRANLVELVADVED